jgi:hypothetical protein
MGAMQAVGKERMAREQRVGIRNVPRLEIFWRDFPVPFVRPTALAFDLFLM